MKEEDKQWFIDAIECALGFCTAEPNNGFGQWMRPVPLTKRELESNILNTRHLLLEMQEKIDKMDPK